MNIAYEFSKIRESFSRVKKDMAFLSEKIVDNYEDFMKKHQTLSREVEHLSTSLSSHLHQLKERNFDSHSDKAHHDIKLEVRELKKELEDLQKEHSKIQHTLQSIRDMPNSNSENVKEVKERVHNSELELYLLKERMVEKDIEVKQLKDVTTRLFDVVDELAKTEQAMLKLQK